MQYVPALHWVKGEWFRYYLEILTLVLLNNSETIVKLFDTVQSQYVRT